MESPRSIMMNKRLLGAAFWLLACAGSWAFAMSADRWPEPVSFLFAYLAIGGPVVAIGAALGRMWIGLVAGLVALGAFLHLVLPMLH
jgi:hypothetical protein